MQLAVVVGIVSFTKAHRYLAEYEDDELFSDCPNQPENVLNIHGLANLTELTFTRQQDNFHVSGNFTLLWNIEKTDRVQGTFVIFKYDRREWVPTLYTIKCNDFCPILFDKNQYWYSLWTKYITNIDEIKNKCLNVPGTKIIQEDFDMHIEIANAMDNMEGEHKIRVELQAFDQSNRMRPTSICYEVKVNFVKLARKLNAKLP
ncbi:uncharacterized protein LOC133845197 [Drosophila sulfurigaster albostrigata]|uniref:uncharacterized protein LOC133845197 n=1 Tax=Drosophila sulfurigaster albostrigata TaxID=89887 RepID=UPI002D21C191|nr:uncharacterized protein LOC133845197 [Drosophila sulfurigaster albostrigata]